MTLKGALAIFVKTPELSEVKTRLAADISNQKARKFYDLALDATLEMAINVKSQALYLDVFWAVAEEEGLKSKRWSSFPKIFQGGGGLGDRLHTVYSALLDTHEYVTFIGADSPHIKSSKIVSAIERTRSSRSESFILGKTLDGGFYFFGGGQRLPNEVWTSVEYSSAQTAVQLEANLKVFAGVEEIESNFDIDTIADLQLLGQCDYELLPAQLKLVRWAKSIDIQTPGT